MQLQLSALREVFSLCSCTCAIFPGGAFARRICSFQEIGNIYFMQLQFWSLSELFRRMSETPTTTTSQKKSQYTSNLYCNTPPICIAVLSVPMRSEEKETLSELLPFVSRYASHLYCNTPPICIFLGESWRLWSPGCSPTIFAEELRDQDPDSTPTPNVCRLSMSFWVGEVNLTKEKGSESFRNCSGSSFCDLSGPVSRDTARLSQRYPPIARYGVFGVSTWPIGCDTPSPFSERFPL